MSKAAQRRVPLAAGILISHARRFDEHRPEDVETKGDDHCADRDRYLLMSLHEGISPKPLNEVERKLKEFRERDSSYPLFNE